MIAIVNYGMGNLGSIANMIRRIGGEAVIADRRDQIKNSDKIVLPGIGNFDSGMKQLQSANFIETLNHEVLINKKVVLGICLGMQLMTKRSEEAKAPGLNWIDGEVKAFNIKNKKLKIPHMGWNTVDVKKNSPLFNNDNHEKRFYFVHSFHVVCKDQENEITKTHYGYDFVSTFQKQNIFGVQFHPEKSHSFGMDLFQKFLEI